MSSMMEVALSEISPLFLIRTCHLAADGFPSTRLFGPSGPSLPDLDISPTAPSTSITNNCTPSAHPHHLSPLTPHIGGQGSAAMRSIP
jgi:hypothetical protein